MKSKLLSVFLILIITCRLTAGAGICSVLIVNPKLIEPLARTVGSLHVTTTSGMDFALPPDFDFWFFEFPAGVVVKISAIPTESALCLGWYGDQAPTNGSEIEFTTGMKPRIMFPRWALRGTASTWDSVFPCPTNLATTSISYRNPPIPAGHGLAVNNLNRRSGWLTRFWNHAWLPPGGEVSLRYNYVSGDATGNSRLSVGAIVKKNKVAPGVDITPYLNLVSSGGGFPEINVMTAAQEEGNWRELTYAPTRQDLGVFVSCPFHKYGSSSLYSLDPGDLRFGPQVRVRWVEAEQPNLLEFAPGYFDKPRRIVTLEGDSTLKVHVRFVSSIKAPTVVSLKSTSDGTTVSSVVTEEGREATLAVPVNKSSSYDVVLSQGGLTAVRTALDVRFNPTSRVIIAAPSSFTIDQGESFPITAFGGTGPTIKVFLQGVGLVDKIGDSVAPPRALLPVGNHRLVILARTATQLAYQLADCTVRNPQAAPPPAPVFTLQPWPVCIRDGEQQFLRAAAFDPVSGSSIIKWRWTRDGVPVPGATSEILGITPDLPGTYQAEAIVGDRVTLSNPVAVVAQSRGRPPLLVENIWSEELYEGDSVLLVPSFASALPLTYIWHYRAVGTLSFRKISTSASPSLLVRDPGDYQCSAENTKGVARTGVSTITFLKRPLPLPLAITKPTPVPGGATEAPPASAPPNVEAAAALESLRKAVQAKLKSDACALADIFSIAATDASSGVSTALVLNSIGEVARDARGILSEVRNAGATLAKSLTPIGSSMSFATKGLLFSSGLNKSTHDSLGLVDTLFTFRAAAYSLYSIEFAETTASKIAGPLWADAKAMDRGALVAKIMSGHYAALGLSPLAFGKQVDERIQRIDTLHATPNQIALLNEAANTLRRSTYGPVLTETFSLGRQSMLIAQQSEFLQLKINKIQSLKTSFGLKLVGDSFSGVTGKVLAVGERKILGTIRLYRRSAGVRLNPSDAFLIGSSINLGFDMLGNVKPMYEKIALEYLPVEQKDLDDEIVSYTDVSTALLRLPARSAMAVLAEERDTIKFLDEVLAKYNAAK